MSEISELRNSKKLILIFEKVQIQKAGWKDQ